MFFDNWPKAQRIEVARTKMHRVVDHLLYLLALEANNSFIVYSPILSEQIPRSYAANAFNTFSRSAHQFAVMRLCALWDGVRNDRENIPTVAALVNDDAIIETMIETTHVHAHTTSGAGDDPDFGAEERTWAIEGDKLFRAQQARKDKHDLREALDKVRKIVNSPQLKALMHIRHKHLAHNLSKTDHEKHGAIQPTTYGEQAELIEQSIPIVEPLYRCVNGTSFSVDSSRDFYRRSAAALWRGCKFDVLD